MSRKKKNRSKKRSKRNHRGGVSRAPAAAMRHVRVTHPKLGTGRNQGDMRVRHTEYSEPIIAGSGTTTYYALELRPFQDTEQTTFKWLRTVSQAFSKYKWHRVHLRWMPAVATTEGGQIAYSLLYEKADINKVNSFQSIAATFEASVAPVWDPWAPVTKLDTSRLALPFYAITPDQSHSSSQVDEIPAILRAAVVIPNANQGLMLGRFEITYDIELVEPIAPTPSTAPAPKHTYKARTQATGPGSGSPTEFREGAIGLDADFVEDQTVDFLKKKVYNVDGSYEVPIFEALKDGRYMFDVVRQWAPDYAGGLTHHFSPIADLFTVNSPDQLESDIHYLSAQQYAYDGGSSSYTPNAIAYVQQLGDLGNVVWRMTVEATMQAGDSIYLHIDNDGAPSNNGTGYTWVTCHEVVGEDPIDYLPPSNATNLVKTYSNSKLSVTLPNIDKCSSKRLLEGRSQGVRTSTPVANNWYGKP